MNANTGELFRFNNYETDEQFLKAQATLKDKLIPITEEEYNQRSLGIFPEEFTNGPYSPGAKVYSEPKIRCKRTHADKKKKARRKIVKESKRKNR